MRKQIVGLRERRPGVEREGEVKRVTVDLSRRAAHIAEVALERDLFRAARGWLRGQREHHFGAHELQT